jgi:hypothetical protein
LEIQPALCLITRLTVASESPPMKMGGCGCRTGLGRLYDASKSTYDQRLETPFFDRTGQ